MLDCITLFVILLYKLSMITNNVIRLIQTVKFGSAYWQPVSWLAFYELISVLILAICITKSNSDSNNNYFDHCVTEGYAHEISVFTGTHCIQTKITNNVIWLWTIDSNLEVWVGLLTTWMGQAHPAYALGYALCVSPQFKLGSYISSLMDNTILYNNHVRATYKLWSCCGVLKLRSSDDIKQTIIKQLTQSCFVKNYEELHDGIHKQLPWIQLQPLFHSILIS